MGQNMWGYRCFLVAIASLALATPLRAEDDAASESSPSSGQNRAALQAAAERRIEAALDSPLRAPLEFIETPLNQVTQVLSEDYQIPIVIDAAALDAVASSPEVEVSIAIGNVTLRSAFELMLKSVGEGDLTYVVDNEVLMITTQEEAEKRLEVVVYRVDDLVAPEESNSIDQPDYDTLIDAIVETVEYDTWAYNGNGEGKFVAYRNMLVIAQSQRVHDRIEQFLERLRSVKQAIDTDMTKAQPTASNRLITHSIRYNDKEFAESRENRNTIRNVIRQSVDWEQLPEGVDESEIFLNVLPGRILVRHVPEVVRQVQRVAGEVCGDLSRSPYMNPNRGGGSGGNGAEATGDSGVAPTK